MLRSRSRGSRPPYEHRSSKELILRDMLALDRTILANERTLMAYVRTALALLVTGVTLVHFFDIVSARILGYAVIPSAPLILGYGIWRYRQVKRHLSLVASTGAPDEPPQPPTAES